MKRIMRSLAVTVLAFAIFFADSAIALAAEASNMQEVTKLVTEAGMRREKKVVIDYTGDESEFDTVDDLFSINYPFGFLYGNLLMLDDPTTSNDADYLVGNIDYTDLDYSVKYENRKLIFNMAYYESLEQTEYVNSHVGEILSGLRLDGKSNFEKVKLIHDFVCYLITYDNESEDVNSMYGALVNRRALCNAYALCMYKLCVEAGIPCKYIGGYAGSGRDAGGHAWNIVALGDKWYFLDATWDDEDDDDDVIYDYFLKGTEDFDETNPQNSHHMDRPFYASSFKGTFPIARTAFEPGSPDENTLITVAGTNPGNPDPEVTYQQSEVYVGKYPSKKTITVKKNKMTDLQIELTDPRAAALVCDVSYEVTKGEKYLKKITNYGIQKDEGIFFTDLELYGKKKGKFSVTIHLLLVNGQRMDVKFNGKVK